MRRRGLEIVWKEARRKAGLLYLLRANQQQGIGFCVRLVTQARCKHEALVRRCYAGQRGMIALSIYVSAAIPLFARVGNRQCGLLDGDTKLGGRPALRVGVEIDTGLG